MATASDRGTVRDDARGFQKRPDLRTPRLARERGGGDGPAHLAVAFGVAANVRMCPVPIEDTGAIVTKTPDGAHRTPRLSPPVSGGGFGEPPKRVRG
eukprot:CAMPEP_0197116982 /NCGR_PEP_ID=MMETSP1390-20130617/481_1 /TAXON_ID=38833 /ORGANISM="Micromonas sp., Strain CCMP2099" /LENGTH=96 /DNA_ID=CAMNT_0042558229 /DNA_START=259 /DNA_END=547 /DNA_ORIENTATION=+